MSLPFSLPCRLPGDQRIFSINKGVMAFDYCQVNNILVTGGMDQVIYLWNPYISERAIGVLYGQGSPVFSLKIDSFNNRICSISNDNTIKMWDLIEHTCLSTITSATHKIYSTVEGNLNSSCSYTCQDLMQKVYHDQFQSLLPCYIGLQHS